jgi:hypothetical protein
MSWTEYPPGLINTSFNAAGNPNKTTQLPQSKYVVHLIGLFPISSLHFGLSVCLQISVTKEKFGGP